jgi:hypothetical protein
VATDPESVAANGPGWEERRTHRAVRAVRWERRAAALAAHDLAHFVFGPRVEVRLSPWEAHPPLTGLLELRVPFASLDDHRSRETLFLALAAADPVVAGRPFVYVFEPLAGRGGAEATGRRPGAPAAGPGGLPDLSGLLPAATRRLGATV